MKFNKQSGQASRLLLVLAVVVLVAAIVTFMVMKMVEKPAKPSVPEPTTIPMPVYEQTLSNIRFIFEAAIDRGDVLRKTQIVNKQYDFASQKDFKIGNPGAKFIIVTIGAQNVGKVNTEKGVWTIENIVDSEGREFIPIQGYAASPWTPNPDLCGALLKPAFDPTPCVKIYEVSKESTGLKIRVVSGKDNKAQSIISGKIDTAFID